MSACAEHVQYQLPNEHSRVGFLMQDYRLQWLVSRRTMAQMVCGATLREPSHIYYHTTL